MNEIQLLSSLRSERTIIKYVDSEVNAATSTLYLLLEFGEIDLAHLIIQQQQQHQQLLQQMQQQQPPVSTAGMLMMNGNFIRFCWQQMLEAVQTVHNRRIVHTDLKPANFVFVKGTTYSFIFIIVRVCSQESLRSPSIMLLLILSVD